MFYAPPPPEYVNVAPLHAGSSLRGLKEHTRDTLVLSGIPRDSVKVGRSVYPFRAKLIERVGPTFYSLDGFHPDVVGEGRDTREARENFEYLLHERFQEICGIADFDRTPEQRRLWERFNNLIDVAEYEQTHTVTVIQMGVVLSKQRPGQPKVRWASGATQFIDLNKATPEFATLRVGQWFEAVLRKRYIDDHTLSVEHVSRIREPVYTASERAKFWQELIPGQQAG